MCVTADDDGLRPAWNKFWNVAADDGLTENHSAKNVADGAVGRLPHLLQAEFFDASFVGGNGGALDAYAVLQDGVSRVNGDLVIGGIAVLHAQVVVLKIDVEVREDETVLNELPDDAGHFVTVEFDDRIVNLDLRHGGTLSLVQQAPNKGAESHLYLTCTQ